MLCERKSLDAQIGSMQSKGRNNKGQEQLANQEMKDNHTYLMIKSI